MLCHAPSLMVVKNFSTLKIIVYVTDERLHFNLVEPVVGFNLTGNYIFSYEFNIEDLNRFSRYLGYITLLDV